MRYEDRQVSGQQPILEPSSDGNNINIRQFLPYTVVNTPSWGDLAELFWCELVFHSSFGFGFGGLSLFVVVFFFTDGDH